MRRDRLILVAFSTFIWLHLIPSVFPTPWQNQEQIRIQAEEAARNVAKYQASGIDGETGQPSNADEWEDALFREYRAWWLTSISLLSLGIFATVAIASNWKCWPGLIMVPALLTFLVVGGLTVRGLYIAGFSESLRMYMTLLTDSAYRENRLPILKIIYFGFIWPSLCLSLALFALRKIVVRRRATSA